MILASLRDLAVREHLLTNPDYEPKAVAWVIQVGEGGEFLGLVQAGEGKRFSIPRRTGRTSAASPDFLVDKSEYVLGVCRQEQLPKPRKPTDLAKRSGLFRAAVAAAYDSTGLAPLKAVIDFLSDREERERCAAAAEAEGYKNNDLFAFRYQGGLVHDIPEVQAYFSSWRGSSTEPGVQCLVCGRTRAPVDKHPGVRVPGGTTSGIALVSFNSDAFESFGLSRNDNAPVCRECADAYTTALNRCLDPKYVDQAGNVLSRRSVRLCPDTAAVYWAEGDAPVVDLFSSLLDAPTEEVVKHLFLAPQEGREPAEVGARFYCLLISGGQGRATLRGLHTQTLGAAERNVREYFRALDIGQDSPFPLWVLLRSLALQGKTDNLSPNLASDFFLAVLFGRPFPRTLLSVAVARCRAERKVSRERAALLRACLIRNYKMEVTVSLDMENMEPGYRLGRLLAVLERLQADAQNKPNKTIVDRFYGAASTRPATVFPSLIRLAQHHVAKLQSAGYHQKRLGEVLDGIAAFPATLRLDEQGLFALGYYHQRQEFFRPRETEPQSQIGEKE
jgi:CRISPR-associated protein Csd1